MPLVPPVLVMMASNPIGERRWPANFGGTAGLEIVHEHPKLCNLKVS
jgi:hypothetical protein